VPTQIDLIPAPTAGDDTVQARLTTIVSSAYAVGEAGMWRPGVARVTPAEIAELIRAEQILALTTDREVIGCVRVHQLSDATWGFGMLAVDPNRQGSGGGGALVDAAEHHARTLGARTMQLELLVPVHGDQASKIQLKAWYSSRGYLPAGQGALERDHPSLIPLLAVRCTYEIWQKELPEEPSHFPSRA
jgi:GNAT superfamily N-acetyltransferase